MNTVIYNLMNKTNNTRIIDEEYIEKLYQYYEYASKQLNYEVSIEKEEFKKIFIIIYDVLRLKISEEEFRTVSESYLKLLIADAKDGHNIDHNWFINHIWYLCVGISKDIDIQKYNDCILFIQQRLIKEFNVKEKISDKIKRKIYTNYMVK